MLAKGSGCEFQSDFATLNNFVFEPSGETTVSGTFLSEGLIRFGTRKRRVVSLTRTSPFTGRFARVTEVVARRLDPITETLEPALSGMRAGFDRVTPGGCVTKFRSFT